jgi:hypothetical protein
MPPPYGATLLTARTRLHDAAYKITVDTNRQPPQLIRLFSDMLAVLPPVQAELLEQGSGANVLSFQYPTGADATMLVSKNAGRYRLQSDCFEAMGLVLSELCRRLEAYYKEAEEKGPASPEGPFQVSYKESLPMQVLCRGRGIRVCRAMHSSAMHSTALMATLSQDLLPELPCSSGPSP